MMKVCGFTFVRNAEKYVYPVLESIHSILPVCDKLIVNVGNSEDNTLQLIESIESDKIQIIQSIWDDTLREGGKVLAVETNKALDAIPDDYDWAFYIQADEVVHEQYLPEIRGQMEKWKDDPQVEGLLFNYTHFYGTYDYIADSRKWYRNEIRIIRNDKSIRSYKDAQGFRKHDRKLKVKPVNAHIYHYGWVKHPRDMRTKLEGVSPFWHDEEWIDKNVRKEAVFDFSKIDSLTLFNGTHPEVMKQRIASANWKIDADINRKKFKAKDRLLYWIERKTGWRPFEYKNYEIIK